jgi:thymidylate synthase ThyX
MQQLALVYRVISVYQDLLEAGVAKECAREVLPMATPTTLVHEWYD